jgi:hypothetical protein
MARAQYFVVKNQSGWHVKLMGEQYGPYSSQAVAMKAALSAAQKAGELGHEAQVVVQGPDNLFRTEWTYGTDPYPVEG